MHSGEFSMQSGNNESKIQHQSQFLHHQRRSRFHIHQNGKLIGRDRILLKKKRYIYFILTNQGIALLHGSRNLITDAGRLLQILLLFALLYLRSDYTAVPLADTKLLKKGCSIASFLSLLKRDDIIFSFCNVSGPLSKFKSSHQSTLVQIL